MRIVGGKLASRTFAGPASDATRPTSDRAREAIASAVEARRGFEGALVLDLFAGTGAFSFEALSRGARRAIAVDSSRPAIAAIERSARELGLGIEKQGGRGGAAPEPTASLQLILADLSKRGGLDRLGLERGTVDLVFADPPWRDAAGVAPVLEALVPALGEGALVVVVHAARDQPPPVAALQEVARYRYGDTAVVIYAPAAPASGPEVP